MKRVYLRIMRKKTHYSFCLTKCHNIAFGPIMMGICNCVYFFVLASMVSVVSEELSAALGSVDWKIVQID